MTFAPGEFSFQLFGTAHIAVMMLLLGSYICIFLFRKTLRSQGIDRGARFLVAAVLLTQEVSLNIYRYEVGIWTLDHALPLHFCNMLVLASVYLMFSKNKMVFDFVYLMGLAGTLQAILTPALQEGFPHFRFYQFFTAHGMIIFSGLYFVFVHKYKPDFSSVKRTFLVLNLMLPPLMIINYLTGGNYNNLNRVPDVPTLIDFLGPWPYYLIPLEILAIIFLLVAYAPFFLRDKFKRPAIQT